MDGPTDSAWVHLDIPDPEPDDANNPAADPRQQPHDLPPNSYNYHTPRSGVPDEAYDLEADADDDNDNPSHGRFPDHSFIPLGGNLVFRDPDDPHQDNRKDTNDTNGSVPRDSPSPHDPSQFSPAGTDDRPVLNWNDSLSHDVKPRSEWVPRLTGMENEGYDGDSETDRSMVLDSGGQFQSIPLGDDVDDPAMRDKDPFPILERPVSGRYIKNPSLERKKPKPPPGPYDPQVGLYITPPSIAKKTEEVPSTSSKVRKRIPRPPSKLQIRCAYAWSCVACLTGPFFCAIPALRYTVSASESAKIHDYNSARSYLRKAYILCAVALALAIGGWTILILNLTGNIGS